MNKQKVLSNVTVKSKSRYHHSEKNMTPCLAIIFSFLLSQLFSWPQRPLLVSESRQPLTLVSILSTSNLHSCRKRKPHPTTFWESSQEAAPQATVRFFFFQAETTALQAVPPAWMATSMWSQLTLKRIKDSFIFFPIVRRVQDVFTSP